MVLLNLAIGPLLFKAAVLASGEARALGQGGATDGRSSKEHSRGRGGSGGGRSGASRDSGIQLIPIIDTGSLEIQLANAEW